MKACCASPSGTQTFIAITMADRIEDTVAKFLLGIDIPVAKRASLPCSYEELTEIRMYMRRFWSGYRVMTIDKDACGRRRCFGYLKIFLEVESRQIPRIQRLRTKDMKNLLEMFRSLAT